MKVQWKYLVLDERQNGNNLTEEHWDKILNLRRCGAFIKDFLLAFVYRLLSEIISVLITAWVFLIFLLLYNLYYEIDLVIFIVHSHHRLLLMDMLPPAALKDLWAIACFLIPGISESHLDFTKVASAEMNEDHHQRVAMRLQRVRPTWG